MFLAFFLQFLCWCFDGFERFLAVFVLVVLLKDSTRC